MPLVEAELTRLIIQAFYEVHSELGFGLPERVYSKAMLVALRALGLNAEREVLLPLYFRNRVIATVRADTVVESKVILEYKATNRPVEVAEAQLLTYLRCTPIEIGFVMSFGLRARFKRYYFSNSGKSARLLRPHPRPPHHPLDIAPPPT